MQIKARLRIHKKKYKKYEWENAILYLPAHIIPKIRHLDKKEITIVIATEHSAVSSHPESNQKYIRALKLLNKLLAKAKNAKELILSLSPSERTFLISILSEVSEE